MHSPSHASKSNAFGSFAWGCSTCLLAIVSVATADGVQYLSDQSSGIVLQHQQQWGDFGLDKAASAPGGIGAPMQIGQTKYEHGLGHHANGEITIDLCGRYRKFRSLVGVHWQGGNKGSVIFRVLVDDVVKFETKPMSDSDAPKEVELPLDGARQLRLVATDAGDGIGCDMANWAEASLERDPSVPCFGNVSFSTTRSKELAVSNTATGLTFVAATDGPQLVALPSLNTFIIDVAAQDELRWAVSVQKASKPIQIAADISTRDGGPAEVSLSIGEESVSATVRDGEKLTLTIPPLQLAKSEELVAVTRGSNRNSCVCWNNLRYIIDGTEYPVPLQLPVTGEQIPPPAMPAMRTSLENVMIEWDWRMQDGIGTAREPRSWRDATGEVMQRGDQLVEQLRLIAAPLGDLADQWDALKTEIAGQSTAGAGDEPKWRDLWRRVHTLRREIVLANPLAQTGPLLFAKRVPSGFSHQLTQYGGHRARPGGGIFVLEDPGQSMRCKQLGQLPPGSYMHPDVSWDGNRVLFAFCETDPNAKEWNTNFSQFYHLFEIDADGSNLRQLTDGDFDDFSPCYMPNGEIMFVSTRRGGFHRCGRGPCRVYTLALMNSDGEDIHVVSFHETHEWDPAVLNDGRVIYTRWDYVDRHAVHYQQLWSVRQDGSDVRAFYGNNTLNPVGVWEARPIPGSPRVMATAAAHHAMTAGSIITLDVAKGMDGLAPIDRLTPDALFPESEFPVQQWHATAGLSGEPEVPIEEQRWPGHCYRSPYPLSEDFFLAAYSFDPLIGEPNANAANMFGIYVVDRFGNKELLYRDANIGSLWPMPLRARRTPPATPSVFVDSHPTEGTFWLQDVYTSWPGISASTDIVKSLRVLQVLPKTTPHANTPRVGSANASPGKQVLGTVPVEKDGSAYFRAPAGIPLAFQALDENGMAIQTMRSLTYLQPGERVGCIGCHEHRTTSSAVGVPNHASLRPPSEIAPGPDGSKPFSYALLVQPILDKHCVACHGDGKKDGNIDLTGRAAGQFSQSYNSLIPLVSYSEWKGTPQANYEPLTHPGQFGARASRLTQLLLAGHEGVELSEQEWERLITWMDTNALFYGTFAPEDQLRQLKGERIAGPALE